MAVVVGPDVVVISEVLVAADVVVAPEVLVTPEVLVAPVVVVVGAVVLVVVGGAQPVTQKTLCLTSAPWEPSALIVSLTWKPCTGCGVMPVKSRV